MSLALAGAAPTKTSPQAPETAIWVDSGLEPAEPCETFARTDPVVIQEQVATRLHPAVDTSH
jgi:hypothetical protein